jgi:signal transduction histidine kinase
MVAQLNPKLTASYQRFMTVANFSCGLMAILVLIGWLGKIPLLQNPIPGQIPLAPLPAVLISLAALSCWLLAKKPESLKARVIGHVAAILVCVFSLSTLARFAFPRLIDLEGLLCGGFVPQVYTSYLARTAPTEATASLMSGLALLLLGRQKDSYCQASQFLAALMAIVPFFALVGYWYAVPFFYGVAAYTQMALETAAILLVQAIAIFFAKPDTGPAGLLASNAAGGVMLRQLLPTAIMIPLVYGWLKIIGQRFDLFERDFGTTLLILLMIVSYVIVVFLNAKHLNSIDAERERLLEQRDNVMAVLTHDLKSPLIGADRVLELFVTGTLGQVTPEQGEVLAKLKRSNEDLLSSIQNLLELYRYDRGTETLRFTDVDLLPIIARCIEELRPQLISRRLNLITLLPERLTTVKVDATAIKHVLSNLIHNAIKFTPDGGEIEVSAQEQTGVAIVKVKDTGKGISREEQESLFQPFSRGTLGKKYKTGTGLGLYLCYQIVKAHRGVLACISEVGTGTSFVVSLPSEAHPVNLLPEEAERAETV